MVPAVGETKPVMMDWHDGNATLDANKWSQQHRHGSQSHWLSRCQSHHHQLLPSSNQNTPKWGYPGHFTSYVLSVHFRGGVVVDLWLDCWQWPGFIRQFNHFDSSNSRFDNEAFTPALIGKHWWRNRNHPKIIWSWWSLQLWRLPLYS